MESMNTVSDVEDVPRQNIETAKHVFCRRDICTPVLRLRQYQDKQRKVALDGWWYCTACEARGPDLNKKFCSAYSHKQMKHTDSDHTDHDSDGDYPGHKVRKEAYNRM
eukprot:13897642-Heterocapsa_arctica.AAC.1